MGLCFSGFANIIYYAQKISYCVALLAVTSCLLVTLVVTLGVGIGMGYHYAVVEHMSLELKALANTSSGASASNSSRRKNIYYRRNSPLSTANLTEEEVPIQRYRTYRRRRSNGFDLNSSHLFSSLPDSFKLTTIRTINNFSTTYNINTPMAIDNLLVKLKTTKKITELLNSTTPIENIRLQTMPQFLGKMYTNNNISGKVTKFNGTQYYYGNSKDKFRTIDQKLKQLYFFKSLKQIYPKLMSNSSSSAHL